MNNLVGIIRFDGGSLPMRAREDIEVPFDGDAVSHNPQMAEHFSNA